MTTVAAIGLSAMIAFQPGLPQYAANPNMVALFN
jgi:hypothetical protein